MAFIQLKKVNDCIQEYKGIQQNSSTSEFNKQMIKFLEKYNVLNSDERDDFWGWLGTRA